MLKKYILEFTVFICGALVMIYEIIGSRLLSPYLGASTYVWTSLIGVILAALSLGYWFGGKFADKQPNVKSLAAIIFLAGGLVSTTVLLKDLILSLVASINFGLEIKSVLAAVLLFAPASVLLGFVTPYAVKLKISSLSDSGQTVGRIYAFSTVGSISGTFLAGFFLIPFVGSVRTLYIIAAGLFGLSLLLAPFALTRFNISLLVLLFFGIGASEFSIYYSLQKSELHDIDTEYNRIQVFKTVDPRTNKTVRAMAIDPFFIQSAIFFDSDAPVLEYTKYFQLGKIFNPNIQKALLIGGAGYTFPRDFLRQNPNSEIEVVEIDPQMKEIAEKYFNLRENPRLKITHQDGRIFINNANSAGYDAVFMDAFGSMFSVPFQLTTLESAQQIERILNDQGFAVFNLGGAISGNSSRFLRAEIFTLKQVFPQVLLFKINSNYSDEQLQNLVIFAFKEKISSVPNSDDADVNFRLSHLYNQEPETETQILTDDLAPVEFFNSFAQGNYRNH